MEMPLQGLPVCGLDRSRLVRRFGRTRNRDKTPLTNNSGPPSFLCRPPDNAKKPGLETRSSVKTRFSLQYFQVTVVQDIFGQAGIPTAATDRPGKGGLVLAGELFPQVFIAVPIGHPIAPVMCD